MILKFQQPRVKYLLKHVLKFESTAKIHLVPGNETLMEADTDVLHTQTLLLSLQYTTDPWGKPSCTFAVVL